MPPRHAAQECRRPPGRPEAPRKLQESAKPTFGRSSVQICFRFETRPANSMADENIEASSADLLIASMLIDVASMARHLRGALKVLLASPQVDQATRAICQEWLTSFDDAHASYEKEIRKFIASVKRPESANG